MTRTATQPRTAKRHRKPAGPRTAAFVALRETYTPSTLRVDREAGVIYGVKVLGVDSANRHGKPVDGTDYLPSAHRSLVGLMESAAGGVRVNKNHTEKHNPNRDRTVGERVGWLLNPRIEGEETYADLHLLKADPDSAKIFEAAERNPRCFALSINADGHYEIKDRRLIIDRFEKVFSVDVVTDGGSTVSLAESHRPTRRKGRSMTLREAFNAVGIGKADHVRIFELGDGTMLKPEAASDEMPEGEDDSDYCLHLGKAMVAILNDGAMDDDTKRKKILAILKLSSDDDGEEGGGAEGETKTEESDEEPDEPEEDEEEDKKKKPVKESLEAKVTRLEREHDVTTLCESLQFQPTATQRKALVALTEAADRKALIETWPKGGKGAEAGKGKGTGLPRSSGTVRTTESAAKCNDAKAQSKFLLES